MRPNPRWLRTKTVKSTLNPVLNLPRDSDPQEPFSGPPEICTVVTPYGKHASGPDNILGRVQVFNEEFRFPVNHDHSGHHTCQDHEHTLFVRMFDWDRIGKDDDLGGPSHGRWSH